MSRTDQLKSFDYLEWLSVGVIVASAAVVAYMVLLLITGSG